MAAATIHLSGESGTRYSSNVVRYYIHDPQNNKYVLICGPVGRKKVKNEIAAPGKIGVFGRPEGAV